MAKGRRFNPSLNKDGRWFTHIGVIEKIPESITSTSLKEIHCPYLSEQVEKRLPPIYKIREKQAANKNFPFSVHDNRHCFENSGYYFDSGLGRRKCTPDQKQHISRNFNLWACDYIPSNLDGFSNNQTSYVHKKAVVVSSFRRFPRCYDERWIASTQSCPKFLGNQPNGEFAVDTKVVSPHPRTGTPSLPEALDEAHDVIPAGVHEVSDPTPPPNC
ncbi:hypothetical gene supported by BC079265 [Rattus norvegicus]|uniref:Hypothetical gene supported by BC079265 n=1 Tax=Rattus norvegicus TaxID=10116 RepID=A6HX18_RAT|nr:hypothetical gene supported by BC079265 [Rattus norvegicus]